MHVTPQFALRAVSKAALQLCAAGLLLHAGSASAISLMQAYEAALTKDPTYQAAVQDAEAGKEYRTIGRSALLPNVAASYSAFKNNTDREMTQFGRPIKDNPEYMSRSTTIQVRQPVLNLEGIARYKQGAAQTDYNAEMFSSRTQEMILRVVGAYCDALFAEEQVRLNRAQRNMYAEQKAVNDHLFAKGEGTKTDMLETQARLDLAEAQLLEAEDNRQAMRATLSGIVGQEVTALDELAPQFRLAPLPEGGLDAWRKLAEERNPELRAQLFAIEAAKQEVNKSRAGHAPRVDFVASYSKNNSETLNTLDQNTKSRAFGVQVNIPLYSGGQVSAVSRQAVAGLERSRAEYQQKSDKIMVDLRKQYASVLSSTARIRALDKAVASSKLLLTATEQSIKGGVRINLDLLNAQQQFYTSQKDLAQARYNYLLSMLKLRAAAGILGPEDVREVATYFR